MAELFWHFLPNDGGLRYGSHEKVEVGKTIKVDCEPILCKQGLHASRRAIDALKYAPGVLVCRVTLGGKIVEGDDKLAATERTVVWMADATETLHRFACDVATDALDKYAPDCTAGYAEIQTKLRWLAGEATYEELASASAVASASASAVASAAAWDVVSAAACTAAWASARAVASAAARDVASAAARDAQNERLESMLLALSQTEGE